MNHFFIFLFITFLLFPIYGKKKVLKKQIDNGNVTVTQNDWNCYCHNNKIICGRKESDKNYCDNKNATFGMAEFHLEMQTILKKNQILKGKEQHITFLTFINGSIESIENGTFDNFKLLETLGFWSTKIPTINDKVLNKNLGKSLKSLSVINIELVFLSSNTFQYLTLLQYLDLRENAKIGQFINNGIFTKSLSNLERLSLSQCNITFLEETVFINLVKLQVLDLAKNPLTSIPKVINTLPQLFSLWMTATNISTLKNDPNLYNSNLKILVLDYLPALTDIEDCAFCSFPQLSKVKLNFSPKLKYIHENAFGPNSIFQTRLKIREIQMESCNITILPESLLNWNSLYSLKINNNPINCNCSISWLINDLKKEKSKYFGQFKNLILNNLKNIQCHSPFEVRNQLLLNIPMTHCKEDTKDDAKNLLFQPPTVEKEFVLNYLLVFWHFKILFSPQAYSKFLS